MTRTLLMVAMLGAGCEEKTAPPPVSTPPASAPPVTAKVAPAAPPDASVNLGGEARGISASEHHALNQLRPMYPVQQKDWSIGTFTANQGTGAMIRTGDRLRLRITVWGAGAPEPTDDVLDASNALVTARELDITVGKATFGAPFDMVLLDRHPPLRRGGDRRAQLARSFAEPLFAAVGVESPTDRAVVRIEVLGAAPRKVGWPHVWSEEDLGAADDVDYPDLSHYVEKGQIVAVAKRAADTYILERCFKGQAPREIRVEARGSRIEPGFRVILFLESSRQDDQGVTIAREVDPIGIFVHSAALEKRVAKVLGSPKACK